MRKFSLQFLITLVLAGITQIFLPWWTLIIAAALGAILIESRHLYTSYLAGFLSLFCLWSIYALWIYSQANGALLPDKVGQLLGGVTGFALIGVSGLLAGVLGGFAALTGTLGRRLLA